MKYSEQIPSFPLNQWIEKIWHCSAEQFNARTLTIPFLNHELVLDLSDHYSIQQPGGEAVLNKPTAFISGLHRKAFYTECAGRHEQLGVLFKIHGLKAFTKHNVSGFARHFTDAELVFDNSISALSDKVQALKTPAQKIAAMENFLLKQTRQASAPSYLAPALQLLCGVQEKGNIAAAGRQLSVSNKSLINAFQKHIGVNPAGYAQLYSINAALKALKKDPGQSLTALAYQLGFFDQAHFSSLFKSLTSLTPSVYAQHAADKNTDSSFPNFISLPG